MNKIFILAFIQSIAKQLNISLKYGGIISHVNINLVYYDG